MARRILLALLVACVLASCAAGRQLLDKYPAQHGEGNDKQSRVLIISIDGLHSADLAWWIQNQKGADGRNAMAIFAQNGLRFPETYVDGFTDSFPGTLAIASGATAATTGVYYATQYDRTLYPPGTCVNGMLDPSAMPGTVVDYSEAEDLNTNDINGGGGINATLLPVKALGHGKCAPVYPHSYPRVNNLFEVARKSKLLTAYSDKEYASYDLYLGPSGTGVVDLYNPESHAEDIFPPFSPSNPGPANMTKEVTRIVNYDNLHTQAVLNWIHGLDHTGTKQQGVPAVYGASWQSLNVAQKYNSSADASLTGGYINGLPGPGIQYAINSLDAGFLQIYDALKATDQLDSTTVIVAAKHGQSPVDVSKLRKPKESFILDALAAAGVQVLDTQGDTIELVWLKDQSDASLAKAAAALDALNNNASLPYYQGFVKVYYRGNGLTDPKPKGLGLPDPRHDASTPDIVIDTVDGLIVGGAKAKLSEHGGLSIDDQHVGLMLSNPMRFKKGMVSNEKVYTRQIAPTILELLGLDIMQLDAARAYDRSRPLPMTM